jgi:hypothetical protein
MHQSARIRSRDVDLPVLGGDYYQTRQFVCRSENRYAVKGRCRNGAKTEHRDAPMLRVQPIPAVLSLGQTNGRTSEESNTLLVPQPAQLRQKTMQKINDCLQL